MTRKVIATHSEDPDGIISHAILMDHLNITTPNYDNHHFLRYDRLIEGFKDILNCNKESDIYVADINANLDLKNYNGENFSLFERMGNHFKRVNWYDHHTGTLENIHTLEKYGFNVVHNSKQSAAPIVSRELSPGLTIYEKDLIRIAQEHDHHKQGETSEYITLGNQLQKIISLANLSLDKKALFELTTRLRDGSVFNENGLFSSKWKKLINQFDTLKESAITDLENSITYRNVAGFNVAFGYSSALLSSKPGARHLKEFVGDKADLYFCFFAPPVRNHAFMGKKKILYPVVEFVKSQGGGGRDNSGGFSYKRDITFNEFNQEVNKLSKKMKTYLLSSME